METPDDGSVTEQEFKQTKFMQNLAGKNSVIGRSIKVTTTTTNEVEGEDVEETVVIGCCVIGHADSPEHVAASLEDTKEEQKLQDPE